MRWFVRILILAVLAAAAVYGVQRGLAYWAERNRPEFRTMAVTEGEIVAVVNSTGEVKPVLSVSVGSFVSGPILELHVDYNDRVEKGQLLAEIDPRTYQAAVDGDRATLAIRNAEVSRVEAELKGAHADETRAEKLRERGDGFISQVEVDQARYARESLEAQLRVAEAGVEQAQAALENSEANLAYTRIESPVDGLVIDRKIEPGQTLAAQFQTPELFVVAPDIRREMHIIASVDEADIGLIRRARAESQPVEFTVDAYPEELFCGEIAQIRLSPTVNQNVVTYPVVVSAPNPEEKLMPGMTAELSFRIDRRPECVRVPNAALRFFPDVRYVRESDRDLITGTREWDDRVVDDESAAEKTAAASDRDRRHVWVWDNGTLRAVPVTIGIRDSQWSELISGKLSPGDRLVVGEKT